MPIRFQKLLLRSAAMLTAIASVVVLIGETQRGVSVPQLELNATVNAGNGADTKDVTVSITIDSDKLSKLRFQMPLFDPPPPVVQEVVAEPPPPLTVQLLGTVINAKNSQAIVKDRQGNIAFRSMGQSVSSDHPDSSIVEISPASITVRRNEHIDSLTVE